MAKPQKLEDFEADMAARQIAVTDAGWQGGAARALLIRSDTRSAFDADLKNAITLREVANMVRAQLTDAGINVDLAIERSIIHGIPLADIRKVIVQRLAERDENTHTNTAQPSQAYAGAVDIYAYRREQMKAGHAR